jgi:hypothetical protein
LIGGITGQREGAVDKPEPVRLVVRPVVQGVLAYRVSGVVALILNGSLIERVAAQVPYKLVQSIDA